MFTAIYLAVVLAKHFVYKETFFATDADGLVARGATGDFGRATSFGRRPKKVLRPFIYVALKVNKN